MRLKYWLLFSLLGCGQLIHAQSYFTAVGVRLGNTIGLTVNQRLQKKWSAEGILQNDLNGTIAVSAIAKRHTAILARGLNIYVGTGPQLRFSSQEDNSEPSINSLEESSDNNSTVTNVGLDILLGAELSLGRINVSLDAKPLILIGSSDFFQPEGAFSARYVLFKTSKAQKKRWRRKRKARKKRNKGN